LKQIESLARKMRQILQAPPPAAWAGGTARATPLPPAGGARGGCASPPRAGCTGRPTGGACFRP